jgi:hypothetical protein
MMQKGWRELKALDTLRAYCKRPDGKYPPPNAVFTLGQPDLPIKNIEVESSVSRASVSGRYQQKIASWSYPYKRLSSEDRGEFSQEHTFFACKDLGQDEWDLYKEKRAAITNGERTRALFDCKRGVWDNYGVPFFGGEEPSEELMQEMMHPDRVKPHTVGHQIYHTICLKVTHETPYSPE